MNYTICRILGPDIPYLTEEGETLRNLKFILENEQDFPGCEKLFFVGDVPEYRATAEILEKHNCEYRTLTKYGFEINRVRNQILLQCTSHKDYVIILDSNQMFAEEGWRVFDEAAQCSEPSYILLGIGRVTYVDCLSGVIPSIKENYTIGGRNVTSLSLPQIAFGKQFDVYYNDKLKYGENDKADLINRLGVPGVWSSVQSFAQPSKYYGGLSISGWVYDLKEKLLNNVQRDELRQKGIKKLEGK